MNEAASRAVSAHEVADTWRRANALSIELRLKAQEDQDPNVMATIKAGLDNAIAEMEKSRSRVAA